MKKCLVFTVSLLFFLCSYASAQLYGIFDRSTDWGGPDSPPQRGLFKVAGRAEVSGSGANAVYTLSGNGDDIWDHRDEGLYIYTQKTGSWRLSAKVTWLDPGPNEWSKAGIMMRESGSNTASKYFYLALRGGNFGDQAYAQWRSETAGETRNYQMYEVDGITAVQDFGNGVYLRITRYAEINTVLCEYSYNGREWFSAYNMTLDLADSLNWGLAVTSHTDDDSLVQARISDVILEPVQDVVAVTREIGASSFIHGQALPVTLNLINPNAQPLNSTLTETPPAGFNITDISNGGTLSNGVITWTLPFSSGESTLTYTATVPADYNPAHHGYIAFWYGSDSTLLFEGESYLFLVNFGKGMELFSYDFTHASQSEQWTDLAGDWGIENGQYYESMDAGGPLVTVTGDSTLKDVAVSVQAMGLATGADWGIVFRAADLGNFYTWQYANGMLALRKYINGTSMTLYVEPFGEMLNEWQDFLVVAKGPVIQCYFNGELQAIVEDDSLTEGQVGLFGWVNSGSTNEEPGFITFDNFTVSSVTETTDVASWSLY